MPSACLIIFLIILKALKVWTIGHYSLNPCMVSVIMKLRQVSSLIWEIKKEPPMQVPVRVYASEPILAKMQEDRTLQQAADVASFPGSTKRP